MPSICDNDKYNITSTQTIILPLSLGVDPKSVSVDGSTLLLKSKFHVTLLPIQQLIERYAINIPNFETSVVEDFCQYVKENPIELVSFSNEYRVVSQNNLKTLVVMCEVTNYDGLFALINKRYNLNMEVPRTHVTIYSSEPDKGIYLINSDDIQQITKIVDIPHLSITPVEH